MGSSASSSCYLSTVQILVPQLFKDPEDGFGLQQVLLEDVASGEREATALLWSSTPYVAATRPETRLPGFETAARAAEEAGFPVLVRNSGGGAVAANEGSISFSLTLPVRDLRHGLYERYTDGSGILVAALGRLGVEAEAGEVEAEFCPGTYSIRAGGPQGIKVAGLAQRVTRRAARVEALVLVEETTAVARVLEKLYGALGLPFRPEGVGDLPVSVPQVVEALKAEIHERFEAEEAVVGKDLLDRARGMRGWWRAVRQ